MHWMLHGDDRPFVQAANSLIESEREKADAARQSFFKIWDKLDRKKTGVDENITQSQGRRS